MEDNENEGANSLIHRGGRIRCLINILSARIIPRLDLRGLVQPNDIYKIERYRCLSVSGTT